MEDEKQMSMFIEMELVHEGYKVDTACDGRETLKKVENMDYDLILLDIMMPYLNGIEVCRRIRVYRRDKTLKNKNDEIKVKDIVMNNETHQVWRGNKEIELTKKEYYLLEMLLINKNIVLTRDKLIEEVWGYDYDGDTNVVDVFIRYLRSKIDDGFEDKLITTVRGVGYVIKDN